MEELVKAAKVVHLSLIAICAAFLAFALAPNDAENYRLAKHELDALRTLPFEQFAVWITNNVALPQIQESASSLRSLLSTSSAVVKVSTDIAIRQPLVVDRPDLKSNLQQVLDFIEKQNSVGILSQLSDDQVVTAVQRLLQRPAEVCSAYGIGPDTPCPKLSSDFMLSAIRLELERPVDGEVVSGRKDSYRSVPETPYNLGVMRFEFSRSTEHGRELQYRQANLRIKNKRVAEGYFARAWILSDINGRTLISTGANSVALPHLRRIWDEVALMTPQDAARFITARESASRRTFSAFGITVDEAILAVAGPSIIFFVLLYLLAELQHLDKTLEQGNHHGDTLAWIVAYPEALARIISVLSVSVLPVITVGTLLLVTARNYDARMLISVLISFGVFVVALVTFPLLNRVRTRGALPERLDADTMHRAE
ncbi:hypothetical protein [Paraburkholderia graminis]|uniref:hypothetical protein n=1 Tax=Paraburkholderia graminis TaxID=60548 RepID=UPI000426C046